MPIPPDSIVFILFHCNEIDKGEFKYMFNEEITHLYLFMYSLNPFNTLLKPSGRLHLYSE